MKPGNPSAKLREGCQFRRNVPRDEGNKLWRSHPLTCRGFLLTKYQVLSSDNSILQNVEEDE